MNGPLGWIITSWLHPRSRAKTPRENEAKRDSILTPRIRENRRQDCLLRFPRTEAKAGGVAAKPWRSQPPHRRLQPGCGWPGAPFRSKTRPRLTVPRAQAVSSALRC